MVSLEYMTSSHVKSVSGLGLGFASGLVLALDSCVILDEAVAGEGDIGSVSVIGLAMVAVAVLFSFFSFTCVALTALILLRVASLADEPKSGVLATSSGPYEILHLVQHICDWINKREHRNIDIVDIPTIIRLVLIVALLLVRGEEILDVLP